MRVDRFGLHRTASVGWLVQHKIEHALQSVALKPPFTFRPPRLKCPHDIDLEARAKVSYPDDPLFNLFLPKDRSGVFAVMNSTPATVELVYQLSRLFGCCDELFRPCWQVSPLEVFETLTVSNIGVRVLTDVDLHSLNKIYKILDSMPPGARNLLLLCSHRIPPDRNIHVIETRLSAEAVKSLPLEKIGAQYLWELMRAKSRSTG
jgi:hypothetical protein